MTSHESVAFRPVSYSPRTERSTSPQKPRIPFQRRSTVHFDDEPAPNQTSEHTTPIETPTPAISGTRACSSNSSATRSTANIAAPTAAAAVRPEYPILEIHDNIELTAVDKKWGRLFEVDGQPTERFRETMHSLARYILHAFPSSESLVLIPSKLASFYNFYSVSSDPFRYEVIFQSKDRDQNRRIADLFQDLGCSYHLVQANPGSPPRVPGLTPDGFTRWMALHLQAFPDGVYQRLDRVISDFPLDVVSALDGRAERLPKQLSRYLLPRVPDGRIRSLLQQAVKRHFGELALLAFSFPEENKERPASRTSQSCPSSPSLSNFLQASPPGPSIPQPRRHDSRDEQRPEQVHRASDPGTMAYNLGKVLTSFHRRHASYPGPQSTLRSSSESARDRRVHSDHDERDRERDSRRHRSPSRSRSSRRSTERDLQAASDKSHGRHRSHQRHHFLKDLDRRSSSRESSRHSSSRLGHTIQGGSDVRRSKYPPSPLSATHECPSASSPSVRDGPRSTTATNTSARRAPSPKPHSLRASLPEIHHVDHRRQSASHETDLGRVTRSRIVDANRRASCLGLAVLTTTEDSPSASEKDRRSSFSDSGRQRGDSDDRGHRTKAREYSYRMERRVSGSGEDKNYRLYASSMVTSPLSSAPVLQYSPSTAPASQEKTTKSESVNDQVQAQAPKVDSPLSSSPRHIPLRPTMSLSATVTTLEHELSSLKDDDGNESDQTWDDYLRTSPRVAPVS